MSLAFLVYSFGNTNCTSRTYKTAEVAAYTLGAYDVWLAVGECDGLMSAIQTRHIASATTNALLTINLREDDGVAVEVAGCDEIW